MTTLQCYEKAICKVLRAGAIPEHVGFIMDGNRRHAKTKKLSSTFQGHERGSKSLQKCLLMCSQLGIKQLSFFCFSIQNFNRSQQQVDGIMKLTLRLFSENSSMMDIITANQMKVNLVGRREKLRADVRDILQATEKRTIQYKRMVVNFCFGYDSIHEIEESIGKMKDKSYANFINGLQIPRHLDILVRTGNEYRLSNFMLPQAAYAYICILKEYWPELSIWSLFKMVFSYNYYHKEILKNKRLITEKMKNRADQEDSEESELLEKYE